MRGFAVLVERLCRPKHLIDHEAIVILRAAQHIEAKVYRLAARAFIVDPESIEKFVDIALLDVNCEIWMSIFSPNLLFDLQNSEAGCFPHRRGDALVDELALQGIGARPSLDGVMADGLVFEDGFEAPVPANPALRSLDEIAKADANRR
ncbi:hypothetical protein D9M70_494740 [compost metagenome]